MTGAVLSDQTTNLLRSNRLRLTSKSWSRALTCRGKWFSASKTHTSELSASFCHIKWSVSNRWPRLNPKPDRAGVGRVSSYPCPSKELPEKPRFTSRPTTSSDLPPPLKRVSRKEFPLFACLVWNQRAFELHTAVLPLTDFPVSFLGSGRAVPFHRHQTEKAVCQPHLWHLWPAGAPPGRQGDSCPSSHSMWGTWVLKTWTRRLETDLTDALWSLGQQRSSQEPAQTCSAWLYKVEEKSNQEGH